MSKIILDFGSGNSCKNDWRYVKRMIDELKKVDTGKHEVIIKWQLFKEAGENIPLNHCIFEYAYHYAKKEGYKTTSSVFDKESLDFLLKFDPCFVKIANNRKLDWLIGEIPRKIPVYVSFSEQISKEFINEYLYENRLVSMACISNYPAKIQDYEKIFGINYLLNCNAISDHTTNFDLWHKYEPEIIEWHYKLEDSFGLDAGPFARTPAQLAEVL